MTKKNPPSDEGALFLGIDLKNQNKMVWAAARVETSARPVNVATKLISDAVAVTSPVEVM